MRARAQTRARASEFRVPARPASPRPRGVVSESILRGATRGGEPLRPAERADLGSRLGVDFSSVRVHRDEAAAIAAEAVYARAFTLGPHIVMGAGQPREGREGRALLAHELTHVAQQASGQAPATVQRDLAIEPTEASPAVKVLSPAEIQAAITYNQGRFTEPDEIGLLRDVLGLDPSVQVIDEAFVLAVVQYQADYTLEQDGKLGPVALGQLSKEIRAETDALGAPSPGLAEAYDLIVSLVALLDAGNTTYADYKTATVGGTTLDRNVALLDQALLTRLRGALSWNSFARTVELLGRQRWTYYQLIGESVVTSELRDAWNDSDVAVPGPATTQHEEGGWVYLNLMTGDLSTRRAAAGAGAAINLAAPPAVADSVVIAKFHTHPNLGAGWVAAPSPQDAAVDATHGVPDIVLGSPTNNARRYTFYLSGPYRREHLAGNRGLPGATGGLAPQARSDGSYDEP